MFSSLEHTVYYEAKLIKILGKVLSERDCTKDRAPPDQLSIPFDILSWAKVIRREFTQCPLKLHRIFPTLISSHLLDCWYKIRVTTSLKFPVFFFRNVRVGALKGNSALVYTKLIYCLPKYCYPYFHWCFYQNTSVCRHRSNFDITIWPLNLFFHH